MEYLLHESKKKGYCVGHGDQQEVEMGKRKAMERDEEEWSMCAYNICL